MSFSAASTRSMKSPPSLESRLTGRTYLLRLHLAGMPSITLETIMGKLLSFSSSHPRFAGTCFGMLLIMASQTIALAQSGLAIGDKTMAGPGTVKVNGGSTVVIFKRKTTNIPLCVTIQNQGPNELVIVVDGENSHKVGAGNTGSYCGDKDVKEIALAAPSSREASLALWRIDDAR